MLLLVIGPTAVGKDTLLALARQLLSTDDRFRFVRRVSTARPQPGGPGVDEILDEKSFLSRRDGGGFAAQWRSNGVFYGVPVAMELDLAEGRAVVANVSRSVVAELAARHPTRLIEIAAPAELLARRLAIRGREDAVDAARRLSRSPAPPAGVPREVVQNDGTVEQGGRRLVAALIRAVEAAPPAGNPPPDPPG